MSAVTLLDRLLKGLGCVHTALCPPCCVVLCCVVPYFAPQLVMSTATAGGRPSAKPTSSGSGGGEGRKAASAAASAGDCETIEHLSATALLQLIKLADATQQLKPLFVQLPLDDGSLPEQGRAGSSSSSGAEGDAAAEVAAAVIPRLPQLLACTDSLLQQGCFKEAQVRTGCLSCRWWPNSCPDAGIPKCWAHTSNLHPGSVCHCTPFRWRHCTCILWVCTRSWQHMPELISWTYGANFEARMSLVL